MAEQRPAGIGDWNEGDGAVPPATSSAKGSGLRAVPPHRRAPRDTVAGCRDSAESDLLQAARMETANGRLRFERSAAAWTARGDLLERLGPA